MAKHELNTLLLSRDTHDKHISALVQRVHYRTELFHKIT